MSAAGDEQTHHLRVPVSDADWSRGPAGAPATLVEYLDYECSHCRAAYPVLERLLQAQGDKLRFVARHFPVVSSHPHAMEAALAAEAAGRQGKFWDMHRELFEGAGELDRDGLLRRAGAIGLDTKRFRQDLEDPELRRKIEEQKREGLRSGVNGTPALFLNGARYDGPRDPESLSRAVEEMETR
jgi:protein-disulfide isomerase